ncbi:MAG: FAD/NAD(P)-binding oxidoreductase [Gemmatimonadaceae bacterium]
MGATAVMGPARSLGHVSASSRYRIVIVGGGTAGLTVAAQLARSGQRGLAIIEPSAQHFYQPLWTLVGAGQVRAEDSMRPEGDYIPKGVSWIHDAVTEIDPAKSVVTTRNGQRVGYDFLVVCPGIQIDWDKIVGLREALTTPHVSSNYDYALAPKTWEMIRTFRGGTALFTNPGTPIKCAGAPQKIMYLAADYFARQGVRSKVVFGHAGAVIFGVKEFAAVLTEVIARYGIDVHFKRELIEVRPATKEAVFSLVGSDRPETETIPYDILHVTPPMSAPDFIKRSPLAVQDSPLGWAKVDKFTLQSPDYPNVFALGDAGSTPNSKTGAAIRSQAPVVAANLLSVMNGKQPARRYNGYASCPLMTAHNRMLLAEFDYDLKPAPSIPFINTQKERYDMFLLKRYGLPWMYWNLMLRGRA